MAKVSLAKVDEAKLKADIKAMKAAKNKEEVDKILAKYENALAELEGTKKEEPKKAAPAKKEEPKKAAPAKKEEPKKAVPAKKEEPKKEEPKKAAPAKKEEPKKEEPKKAPAKKAVVAAAVVEAAPAKKEEPKKATGGRYAGKYEVFQSGDGWAYDLKASNGEILVSSEIYSSKDSVLAAIDAIKRNVENGGEVRVYDDKSGKYQFKLVAKNHRVIAISANYDTQARAERASESFKKFALSANIVEIDASEAASKEDTPISINKRAAAKAGGKFTITKEGKKFAWALKASNGQILAQADGFNSQATAEANIESFKENVAEGSFKCSEDKMGRFFFKLYSPSGRVVSIGESYPAKDSAESAAQTIAQLVKKAEVEVAE